ncbi:MAG TPA: TonB-dependent receptor plug domain-containing protein [Candidatus Angelobacter sp.]|nr:TonB-dependent receptor plug domain-containing protein [Candidatus Angelobacter sp.]
MRSHQARRASVLVLFLTLAKAGAWANPPQNADSQQKDLTQVSIENLMNMEVSSASKKEQSVSRTAAAVFVLTQDDIRRSGMTTLPDVLRLVPGVEVAQIDASKWAVTSRGFNGRFADKLLVLIDGRSLYSPEFAGVFWQVQDLMLEDIDHIEVIRGPGTTLWGANAVAGVINILTKKAKDTQGGLLTAGGGTQERGFTGARYGASQGDKLAYRFYGNYFDRGEFQNATGGGAGDDWDGLRSGFRIDAQTTSKDSLTIEGDVYRDASHSQNHLAIFTPPFNTTPLTQTTYLGGDVLGRWTRTYSPHSEFSLQMYYDGISRDDVIATAVLHVLDIDFQDHLSLGERHDFIWGANYRSSADSTSATGAVSFNPSSLRANLSSVFLQDEVAIVPNRLWFTPGIRFEDTPFTGYNVEPSGRMLWSVSENQSLWVSAALAQRTPQRSERGLHDITAVFPGLGGSLTSVDLFGSPSTGDESVLDFEAGYRAQVTKTVSIDLAAFHDHYSDLQTREPGTPFPSANPVPHVVVPLFYANEMHGTGYGGEISMAWKPVGFWKLDAGYSFLRQVFHLNPGSQDPSSLLSAGDSPRHQMQFRSQFNLPHRTEFDTSVFYIGRLVDQSVPAYTRLDLRIGWHPRESLDLDFVGQNLLTPRHLEFLNNTGIVPSYSTRGAYVRLTWRISN